MLENYIRMYTKSKVMLENYIIMYTQTHTEFAMKNHKTLPLRPHINGLIGSVGIDSIMEPIRIM
jgi:hypothetical protein